MEYRTDKRTKNLTLRDIHVGDWVQVWSEQTERYSPPLKITQICDDGTVYLIIDEENRLDPWEENIKDIDALPIDADLLRGFGFARMGNFNLFNYESYIFAYNTAISVLCTEDDAYHIVYFHDMQDFLSKYYGIKLEWKGIEK